MIGVFDSGIGGLSILKAVRKTLPNYDYMYLGDQARLPYGNKSQENVCEYTLQAVNFLRSQGCKLILIACHTASNLALREIQNKYRKELNNYEFKLLGVTIPLVEAASQETKNNQIGLLATRASCESSIFDDYFVSDYPDVNLHIQEGQLLVSMIEAGPRFIDETKLVAAKYLQAFKGSTIDTLILGCTHFPIMRNEIQEIMGPDVKVLDSPQVVANQLAIYLKKHPQIETQLTRNHQLKVYSTKISKYLEELIQIFNQEKVELEKVDLY